MRTSLITHATPAARAKIAKRKSNKPRKAQNITDKQHRKIVLALLDARGVALNMKEISVHTSIDRSTICRRLDELVKAGRVVFVFKARCPFTGYPNVKFFKLKK